MRVWVIGAGGLLGRSVVAAVKRRTDWRVLDVAPLPWNHPHRMAESAAAGFRALLGKSARTGLPRAVVWAAGSVVTTSQQSLIDTELDQLGAALRAMGSQLRPKAPRGLVFYASSAGGIYGGSSNPLFTEDSAVAPISPYGNFKLAAEQLVAEFASAHQMSSLVARIANLYGPGQKLDKIKASFLT